ncbi:hypothetical protein MUK42_36171 [Musa troglodytarum]|uniref:Uncharacterized protein n=1 Tax=Musa troglodytarum TaxID=320322 RepID=A0A9E7FI73_9LILI|nr:hypothetical protein MUK42_08647 [Musa troglodytarum]URD99012.1 hypothetical protein MUK42_36171 [Musa troglodytarum]
MEQKVAEVAPGARIKRCPPGPSLFFIGGCEGLSEAREVEEEEKWEVAGGAQRAGAVCQGRSIHWRLLHAAEDAEGGANDEDPWLPLTELSRLPLVSTSNPVLHACILLGLAFGETGKHQSTFLWCISFFRTCFLCTCRGLSSVVAFYF